MSLMLDIADAVVVALNAASVDEVLSQTFVSARAYTPRGDLKDYGTLVVTVVPVSSSAELVTRARSQETYTLDVAVQKRSKADDPDDDPTTFDPIILLAEEIQTLLHGATLTVGEVIMTCLESPERPTFDHDHAAAYRQITSVIRLEYTTVR